MSALDLPFTHNGAAGAVHVECVANTDPAAFGVWDIAKDFPACTATVTYERRGYDALFGWVQLVRSTDNRSQGAAFELDPLALFADLHTPYCWFGTTPTLFDAPSRSERKPNTWLAHSFLAATSHSDAMRDLERPIAPVVGLSWGFVIDDREQIAITPPERLTAADWNAHLDYLSAEFPTWAFKEAMPEG